MLAELEHEESTRPVAARALRRGSAWKMMLSSREGSSNQSPRSTTRADAGSVKIRRCGPTNARERPVPRVTFPSYRDFALPTLPNHEEFSNGLAWLTTKGQQTPDSQKLSGKTEKPSGIIFLMAHCQESTDRRIEQRVGIDLSNVLIQITPKLLFDYSICFLFAPCSLECSPEWMDALTFFLT